MKRVKTVISISIILFSLCSSYSCRADEMDIVPENRTLVENINQGSHLEKSGTDSAQTKTAPLFDENGNPIADPPPRDKDQWRHKSQ